jgi:hypothetical protein
LVSSRKINTDQKAQALKKPALQAQLADYEERVVHYKKFAQEYQDKFDAEKDQLLSNHKEELEKVKEAARAEAAAQATKSSRSQLLTLSRFLRAAAARRQLEDDDSELGKAFEGALLLVYGGDMNAVQAAEKLIQGSSESVPSTDGVILGVTCKFPRQIRIPPPTDRLKQMRKFKRLRSMKLPWPMKSLRPRQKPTRLLQTPALLNCPTILKRPMALRRWRPSLDRLRALLVMMPLMLRLKPSGTPRFPARTPCPLRLRASRLFPAIRPRLKRLQLLCPRPALNRGPTKFLLRNP